MHPLSFFVTIPATLVACGPFADTTFLKPDIIQGCTVEQTVMLREAEAAARQRLDEQGPELLSCLREYYLTATNGDSPERIVRVLQRGSFELRCEALGSAVFKAATVVDQGDEAVIRFNPAFLDTQPSRLSLTATLLHELTHARGYRHGDGNPEWVDDPETPRNVRNSSWYDYSVSQQVARCSAAMSVQQYAVSTGPLGDYAASEPNVPRGNFDARSDHERATFLATVGRRAQQAQDGVSLSEQEVACAPGFARGLVEQGELGLTSLDLLCMAADRRSIASTSSAVQGAMPWEQTAADRATTEQACGAAEAVVGLALEVGEQILSARPACQLIEAVQAGDLAERSLALPADSEQWIYRWCPPGMAVERLLLSRSEAAQVGVDGMRIDGGLIDGQSVDEGVDGVHMDGVRIECATLEREVAARQILPLQPTSSGEGNRATFRELCPTGSVVRVFEGRSLSEVDRLEGTCAEVETSDSGGLQYLSSGATAALEGHGGFGGLYSTDAADPDCPSGHALVGVVRSTDADGLLGLNGVCAPLHAWGAEGEVPQLVRLGWMGQESNDAVEELCAPGSFVAGWDVMTGPSRQQSSERVVRGLALHCADLR